MLENVVNDSETMRLMLVTMAKKMPTLKVLIINLHNTQKRYTFTKKKLNHLNKVTNETNYRITAKTMILSLAYTKSFTFI